MSKTSACLTCGKPIEQDALFGAPRWVDPSNLDQFDNGVVCTVTGDNHLPGVVTERAQ